MILESKQGLTKLAVVTLLMFILTVAGVGFVLYREWKLQRSAIETLTSKVRMLIDENRTMHQNSAGTAHTRTSQEEKLWFQESGTTQLGTKIDLKEKIVFSESGRTEPDEHETIIYAWPKTTTATSQPESEKEQDSDF